MNTTQQTGEGNAFRVELSERLADTLEATALELNAARAERDRLLAALRGIVTEQLGRDWQKAQDWANAYRNHKGVNRSLVVAVDAISAIEKV